MKKEFLIAFTLSILFFSCSPGGDDTEGKLTKKGNTGEIIEPRFGSDIILSGEISNKEAQDLIDYTISNFIIGSLVIENTTQLTNVRITDISKFFSVEIKKNENLLRVELPNLEKISDFFSVRENPKLESIIIEDLIETNSISFSGNQLLNEINISNFKKTNSVFFSGNDSMINFELPALQSIGNLALAIDDGVSFDRFPREGEGTLGIGGNNNLESFSFPRLLNLNGIDILISGNKKLKKIDFSKIESSNSSIEIFGNEALKSADFSKMTSIETLKVTFNDSLFNLDFSNLESITGIDEKSDFSNIRTNPLAIINFPKLRLINENITSFYIESHVTTEINLPSLEKFTKLEINTSKVASTLNLNSVINFDRLDVFGISEKSVEEVLTKLVSIDPPLTGSSIRFANPTIFRTQKSIENIKVLKGNGNIIQ